MGNKYRLGRKIGSGSFGDIFLGVTLRSLLVTSCSPREAGHICRVAVQQTCLLTMLLAFRYV